MGIRKVLRKFLQWIARDDSSQTINEPVKTLSRGHRGHGRGPDIEDNNRGMNFTIYNATGGKIVQIYEYNPTTDRTKSELYIITDREDLGAELGMIITRESLTR